MTVNSKVEAQLEKFATDAMRVMNNRGEAVARFTTEELQGVDAGLVEDRMVEAGWEAIEDLAAYATYESENG
jgi:hypothetical protein